MTEVSVHLKDIFILSLQRPLETAYISSSKTEFPTALNEEQAVLKLACHQILYYLCRAVRTTIIDNKDVKLLFQSENSTDYLLDVFLFVVSRNDYYAIRHLQI